MVKRSYKLIFPTELVTEPIVYNLKREYRLTANIERASILEDKGLVVLDLDGSEEDLKPGVAWLMAQGVEVEPWKTEVKPAEVEAKPLEAEVSQG
jgi:hypothetical protein